MEDYATSNACVSCSFILFKKILSEISMGIYTSEEIVDGDFKEYPMENVQEQVQKEISQNANTVPFEEVTTDRTEQTIANAETPDCFK